MGLFLYHFTENDIPGNEIPICGPWFLPLKLSPRQTKYLKILPTVLSIEEEMIKTHLLGKLARN